MQNKDVQRAVAIPEFKGQGYFNRKGDTDVSAGFLAVMAKIQAPYSSTDEQGRVSVDITAPGYHEAAGKALAEYRAQPENQGNTNPMWTMPYMQREARIQDIQSAGCYKEEDWEGLTAQADTFGMESLTEAEQAIVDRGADDWYNARVFMNATGFTDEHPGGADSCDLVDTGRYVSLKAPDGSTSGKLMELAPRMDMHYFLDLELPEGQAQILALKEGTYEVDWEYGHSPEIEAGIQAARDFQDKYGYIFTTKCGGELEAQKSEPEHGVDSESQEPVVDASGSMQAPGSAFSALSDKLNQMDADQADRDVSDRSIAD